MKKINGLLILVIAAASFISSCKKDDKPNTCALNEANFVGSYKIESIKYKATPTSAEIDGSFVFEPCELDDVTTFNTNKTYTYTDAGTACSPKGDESGTWSLAGDSLIVDGKKEFINNFSCTGFSASKTDVSSGGKVTITLKKQ